MMLDLPAKFFSLVIAQMPGFKPFQQKSITPCALPPFSPLNAMAVMVSVRAGRIGRSGVIPRLRSAISASAGLIPTFSATVSSQLAVIVLPFPEWRPAFCARAQ